MKMFGRVLGSAAVLLAVSASAARADLGSLVNGTKYCGGNTFQTCATVNSVSFVGGVVTLTVTNTSGKAGSVFTAIGLANIGGTFAVTNFTTSLPTRFEQGTNSLSGAGIISPVIGANAQSPPPANGLHNLETVTFTFTLSGNPDFTNVQLAIHDQGGAPEGCESSTKLVVTGGVANTAVCGPTTTVPEPMTMSLLATGLVGMGGMGAFKRRRRAA
ncbi:MAG: PEP-CTERM sorting domain-containing protein, partial [Gemmatimonadota bacterium]